MRRVWICGETAGQPTQWFTPHVTDRFEWQPWHDGGAEVPVMTFTHAGTPDRWCSNCQYCTISGYLDWNLGRYFYTCVPTHLSYWDATSGQGSTGRHASMDYAHWAPRSRSGGHLTVIDTRLLWGGGGHQPSSVLLELIALDIVAKLNSCVSITNRYFAVFMTAVWTG